MLVNVIVDGGGNYVSNLSFQAVESGWLFWSLTGIADGFKSWTNRDLAEKIKNQLTAKSQQLSYNLKLTVKEVEEKNIPYGNKNKPIFITGNT